MQLVMPYDAAQVLDGTTLKTDYPEVWNRYLNERIVRVGTRLGARVYTPLGRLDLILILEYMRAWLNDQDKVPDEDLTWEQKRLHGTVSHTILRLVQAIERGCNHTHTEACSAC